MKVCFPWLGGVCSDIEFQCGLAGKWYVAWEQPDRVQGSFYVVIVDVEINQRSVGVESESGWRDGEGVSGTRWACAGHINLKLCSPNLV